MKQAKPKPKKKVPMPTDPEERSRVLYEVYLRHKAKQAEEAKKRLH